MYAANVFGSLNLSTEFTGSRVPTRHGIASFL